ncbi:hypothetical protein VNO78_01918 [Psophocarpus tetragonolobus]|uniref:Uncharacterized protein n=1 Tax=Psophocarpus tetragonolobus TaxID=3891 RepID=A0AAN9XUW5_PSOTE
MSSYGIRSNIYIGNLTFDEISMFISFLIFGFMQQDLHVLVDDHIIVRIMFANILNLGEKESEWSVKASMESLGEF